MDRRGFLRSGSLGAAGLMLSQLGPFSLNAQPDQQNVLFILLEDMPTWPQCYGGHPDAYTPNIDALAARGVLFSNAHCSSPLCNPSRTSLLLGKRPDSTGVYYNTHNWQDLLDPTPTSLPMHFRNSQYTTISSGKVWHRGEGGDFDEPASWDYRYSPFRPGSIAGYDPYTPGHPNNGLPYPMQGVNFMNWGPTDAPRNTIADYRRFIPIKNHLEQGIIEPFFMMYGSNYTHYPSIIPRLIWEKYNPATVQLPETIPGDLDDLPPEAFEAIHPTYHDDVVNHKQYRKGIAAYLAMLETIDWVIGKLLEALDHSPYADNTIIILAADHGLHMGEKQHWMKSTLWHEATQVPFIIAAPGVTTPGSICPQAVSLLDIYPTLIELCGLPTVDGLEGESLVPLLVNPDGERETPAVITLGPENHAVVTEQWRYIQYYNGGEELYNIVDDPHEWTNLASIPGYRPVMDLLATWIPNQ